MISVVSRLRWFRAFVFGSLALGLLAAAAVSCLRFFSIAFGVERSRVSNGFVFVFTCSSASYSDRSFKLTMFYTCPKKVAKSAKLESFAYRV